MPINHDEVHRVIGCLYDAATQPQAWHTALNRMGGLFNDPVVMLAVMDEQGAFRHVTSGNDDPHYRNVYLERYNSPGRNSRVAALLQAPVGIPVLGCEQWDTASFVTSDLYNDVYRPQGLLHDIGVVLVRGAQHNAAFSMLRRTQEEPFAGDELRLITCLIPHLQRAAKLSLRFEQLQLDSAVAYEALDRLPFGLVLLDVHAAVLSMNGMAEDFIRQGDGLVFRNGGLSTLQPAESASLGSLIAEALATAAGTCLTGGGALAVTRPSGKRPFSVLISPMRSRSFDPGRRQCAALLVITDPERHAELPVEIIQRLLQLTRQEAALTVALAGGLDLKEVSQRLGISTHTAHTHLNRAMAKTSTHRQAELVALVYRTIVDLRCE